MIHSRSHSRIAITFLWAAALAHGVAAAAAAAAPAPAPPATAATTFAAKTKPAAQRSGLLSTWLDTKAGKVWLELPAPTGARNECASFLYIEGIRTGLGSNPVGLDRGQLGATRVVVFRRVGARVLVEQPNLRYRAQSPDAAEAHTVRESFATSVLWSGEIAAEAPDGTLLVDFTPFVVRDAHGVVASLKRATQGTFSVDRDRSGLDPANCFAFPENLEFESLLTFTSDDPGGEVRATAPTPQAFTLSQHHSLVRLPDAGYKPRVWDPRSGSFEILFADYAQPVAGDLDVRWLVRHRLEKTDPAAARSRVKKPLVYYVDPGAPEPIRSALMDGAGWWAQAFEAAGFIDAFQVKLLPPDASPFDVRYNVIQWVHRATRGWSYGGGVTDPRTGEMIKGHVSLGSLRIRQDRMIFEGLAGTAATGTGSPDDPVQLALARIRQLAAHEVGHTLGFNHNFVASTYAGRGSVMDYPAPLVGVRPDSTLDFSNAYATGAGVWDVQMVRYAYTQFAPGTDEKAALEAILAENRQRGYLYLSDSDTRPAGAAHPLAAMWDNGGDPVAMLEQEMQVRRIALRSFGERNIPPGTPLSTLEAVLMPLYFHHRYQAEAVAKSVGGLEYSYAVRGDGAAPAQPVAPERQRAALAAVLGTLEPAVLDLPEPLLGKLMPASVEYPPHHESLNGRTAPAFDAIGAAASAADLSVSLLLPAERLARLVDFHRRDPKSPGVEEVLDALTQRVFAGPAPATPRLAEIHRAVRDVTVRRLLAAAAAPAQTPAVRAALEASLQRLAGELDRMPRNADAAERAARTMWARDITRYLTRPAAAPAASAAGAAGAPPDPPPGPPIGNWNASGDCEWPAGRD